MIYLPIYETTNMERYQNPIIQDDPADTLYHVKSVLSVLQEYYTSTDLHERTLSEEVSCGLYWILKCSDNALEFEIKRTKNKAK